MRNLLRGLLFGFMCGALWGMAANERQRRQQREAKIRAFQADPEVIALNKEWEKQDRVQRWIQDAEEGIGDDEG
jgi:hypothetical protein